MNTVDVVRAWKDAEYRSALTELEQQEIPANPAGALRLTEEQVSGVSGATGWVTCGGTTYCLITISYNMSCNAGCDGSGWPASCSALSYGCCGS